MEPDSSSPREILATREESSMASTWEEHLCIQQVGPGQFQLATCGHEQLDSIYSAVPEDELYDEKGEFRVPETYMGVGADASLTQLGGSCRRAVDPRYWRINRAIPRFPPGWVGSVESRHPGSTRRRRQQSCPFRRRVSLTGELAQHSCLLQGPPSR
jgi:hypothetical protein